MNNIGNISVVIPTYNRRETIGRSIDSVLNQTFSEAGFQARYGGRMPNNGGELAIVAFKQRKSEDEIKKIADPLLFG